MNPVWQVVQIPVVVAQLEQPCEQTSHSPEASKKNPDAQTLHFVAFFPAEASVASAQPGLHAQLPLLPHTPLSQPHVSALVLVFAPRHFPLPVIPSSQHESAHCWQDGPKCPGAHWSHCVPANPGAQVHVPLAAHAPPEEQAGVHEVAWTAEKARSAAREGSWAVSGVEAKRTREAVDEAERKVTAMLGGMAKEAGRRGEERFEERPTEVGSPA